MVGRDVFQMWPAALSRPEESVRSLPSGPILTVDRTIFEMWLGAL